MGKQEGIDHLLRMAKHIVFEKARRDVHFILAGGGTELENMKDYVKKIMKLTLPKRYSDCWMIPRNER